MLCDGKSRALIPLTGDIDAGALGHHVDDRLIAGYGKAPEDVGLLVSTPGGAAVEMLDQGPGSTVDEMTVALTRIAVSSLRISGSIALHELGSRIEVCFSSESVPTGWLSSATEACIGSLPGSIAAALVAEARACGVTIESEVVVRRLRTVTLLLQGVE